VSAAARALKGRPDISAATCQRVREAAVRLKYRPDPLLTALSAYRNARRPTSFRETLAFLATRCDEKTWLSSPETGDLLRGARSKAESLGYRLDYFNIGITGEDQRKAWKILRSRGIRGALIRSFPTPLDRINLPLKKFACIDLFSSPHLDHLPTVSSYHAQSMELALQELLKRGCRHPALVLEMELGEYLHHGWWMAFAVYSSRFTRASTCLREELVKNPEALFRWAEKRRVDALIFCSSENLVAESWRKKALLKRMDLVCLDLLDPGCGLAGIYQDRHRGGALAVEWLHGQLLTAQTEAANGPYSLLIPGTWKEGKRRIR